MSLLEITLLGRPQVKLNGNEIEIPSNKAKALLYYLAATNRRHSRQHLGGLLWSESDDDDARAKLRTELSRWLNKWFGEFIDSPRETVALKTEANYISDLARFETILKNPTPTLEQLQAAVELYQGDLLEDFNLDEPLWDEWVAPERERLRQVYRRAVLRLADAYGQARRFSAGINCLSHLLQREPWLEEAHRSMMVLLARSGQRGAVLQQYELCCNVLDQEYGVPPSDETNAIYDKIMAGEIGLEAEESAEPAFTLPSVALPPPFQAPTPITHFVGRSDDLATLEAALMAKKGPRVHALIGMGGIGKTTLATHIAHALREHFVDGVLWASVANSDPLDILGHWAQAYGYNFRGLSDVETRAAALRGVLADKRTLIIVDDVRSVRRTLPLLVGGPQCAMLLTTRDLDVATALNAQPHSVGELAPQEGIHLLTQILGEARVTAEPEAAAEICALLQHLPLAVEITAQRLVSRPRRRLIDMATRLRDVKERLDLAISDRAVRTSFTVSWEALDTNLRHIFALLAVFAGRSFAAPALAHIAGLDVYTTEDRLFALGALSLVGEVEGNRYRQHPLLADFAREQMGEGPEAQKAMAVYYQMFAQQNRTNYLALRPEWENMMAGMGAAHAQHEWPLVLVYTATLTEAWFVRARYTQARQGYQWAYDAAIALSDEHAQAACLLKWGQACIEQDNFAEAEKLLATSMQIYEKLGSETGIASVRYYLARIAIEQAKYDVAEEMLRLSKALREQIEDRIGIAAVLYQQAVLYYRLGQLDDSKQLCEQSLAMQEAINDQAGALPTLRLLADIALEQNAYSAADAYCLRALALCEKLQDRGELAATYYSLTVVARLQEKVDLARLYAQKAIELCRWMGNRRFEAFTFYELSRIYALENNSSLAINNALNSLELLRELQETFNSINIMRHLGDLYNEVDKHEQAQTFWHEALGIAILQNHPLTDQLRARLGQTKA